MKHAIVFHAGDIVAEHIAENFGFDIAASREARARADIGAVFAD